jgi:glycosyltransferase involved in cell wall biosynthesis
VKIAVVHSFYSQDAPSGENSAVNSQVAALTRAGHEVKLFSAQTTTGPQNISYKLRAAMRVAFGSGTNPLTEINKFKPDLVHIHNLFPNYSTNWLSKVKAPVIVSVHNYRYLCAAGTFFVGNQQCFTCLEKGNSRPAIAKKCYRGSGLATLPLAIANRDLGVSGSIVKYAKQILVLTQEAKDVFVKAGWPSSQLQVVPNFIETPKTKENRHQGINSKQDSWVYIGRLSSEKGILELLKDWPKGEKLSIIGDGPLLAQIEQRIIGAPNVELLGRLESKEISEILSNAKGMIFPSLVREGLPLVFLEALSVGCPTIAKDSNVVSHLVRQFNVGEVYSNGTQLSDALITVGKKSKEFQARSLELYKSEFTEEAWVSRVNAIYRSATL